MKFPKLFKRGTFELSDIPMLAIVFGVGIVLLSIIGSITGELKSTQCDSGTYDDDGCYGCITTGGCASGCTYNTSGNSCYNSSGTVSSAVAAKGDYDFNMTNSGGEGLQKMANWFPTIGLVIGAIVIIGALSMLFKMRTR